MSNPQQAARAYLRIMRPISEAMCMAAEADAGFDAGEWSAAAHDRMFEDEECRVIALVTSRFNITSVELVNAVHRSAEREYRAWCANQF